MKVFRIAALVAAMVWMLAACGGEAKKTGSTDPADVTGETVDTGQISALCPDGWLNVPVRDVWSSDADAMDPTQLKFLKGAKSVSEELSVPFVLIQNTGETPIYAELLVSFYENVEDIDPMTLGGISWTGFTGDSFGYPNATLIGSDGKNYYQVTILLKNGNKSISLSDPDVQAIIASIKGQ